MLSSCTKKHDTMYADKTLQIVNSSVRNYDILEQKTFIATYPNN